MGSSDRYWYWLHKRIAYWCTKLLGAHIQSARHNSCVATMSPHCGNTADPRSQLVLVGRPTVHMTGQTRKCWRSSVHVILDSTMQCHLTNLQVTQACCLFDGMRPSAKRCDLFRQAEKGCAPAANTLCKRHTIKSIWCDECGYAWACSSSRDHAGTPV